MASKKEGISRRNFLKASTTMGAGALLGAGLGAPLATAAPSPMPQRPFGKSGRQVPILGLGSSFNFRDSKLLLHRATQLGVTYWDTAPTYSGGQSEISMGEYLARFPALRKKLFLVTKSKSYEPSALEASLAESLKTMRTDYIDLYFLHSVSSPDELSKEAAAWADKAKKQGKIMLFGFSSHSNMTECLAAAPKLGWVDGIMFTCNFRNHGEPAMQRAIEACAKAGIGLTAMKTMGTSFWSGYGLRGPTNIDGLLKRGFSKAQAKLKLIWEDQRIAAICSEMTNFSELYANVAAALNKTKLSRQDKELLEQHASATAPGYCAGCSALCQGALPEEVPVADVLRFLMYRNDYGKVAEARELFMELPATMRGRLGEVDFAAAEGVCPNGVPIAKMMKEAVRVFEV